MALIEIASADDPRLEPFRQVKDRRLERDDGLFIAEGTFVVDRLLASRFDVHALLVAERHAETYRDRVEAQTPVYVLPESAIEQVVGFKFHRGVIGCGVRRNLATLDQVMADRTQQATWVICPEIHDSENLGALIRIAAAFGVDGMLLGPRCTDPLWRRTIRVSMGAAFQLPIVQSEDLKRDLQRLKSEFGVTLLGTVLDDEAEPLAGAASVRRLALAFGSESEGLPRFVVDACDRRVTIPMHLGADSLNVAVSAAVCLYHFTQVARRD